MDEWRRCIAHFLVVSSCLSLATFLRISFAFAVHTKGCGLFWYSATNSFMALMSALTLGKLIFLFVIKSYCNGNAILTLTIEGSPSEYTYS